jgi:hypothetical protein
MFMLVSRLCERASLIVTSNTPFSAWARSSATTPPAPPKIDRPIHHAEILSLKGDSYRPKNHDLGAHPAEQTNSWPPPGLVATTRFASPAAQPHEQPPRPKGCQFSTGATGSILDRP